MTSVEPIEPDLEMGIAHEVSLRHSCVRFACPSKTDKPDGGAVRLGLHKIDLVREMPLGGTLFMAAFWYCIKN
jgi:hypothetical protein